MIKKRDIGILSEIEITGNDFKVIQNKLMKKYHPGQYRLQYASEHFLSDKIGTPPVGCSSVSARMKYSRGSAKGIIVEVKCRSIKANQELTKKIKKSK